ncbi:hypothetical protein [Latilactobacillus curvatus]|uniref:hypothetical protein n=1 Tax=Latilactobacillus curvatus TaxID=28038 RepID=UPI000230F455|nr:hypothetical protein [Latilactobacillus curvatus]EHE86195.1 putative membrane protein [Latilactobacillus curvatus CRL 705]MDT7015989.1 hypothetical protein [Latilactobacillus curvatus]
MKLVNRIAIAIIILLQVSFFSIIETTPRMFLLNSTVYKTLTIFLVMCLLIFNIIFNFDRLNKPRRYHFILFVVISIMAYLLVLWGSQCAYQQSVLVTLKNSYVYFMFVLYLVLVLFFNDERENNFLLQVVKYVGGIYSVVLIVQAVLFNRGITFLDFGSYGLNPIYDSFGPIFHFIRIANAADFISFAMLVTGVDVLIHKEKKRMLIGSGLLLIDYLYIVFVSGTRMYMIADMLIIMAVVVIVAVKKYKGLIFGLLTVMTVGGFMGIPLVINSFIGGKRKLSFDMRLGEIQYYADKIFHNGWFGIGFPDSKRYDQLLHGPANSHILMANANYFLEDIGILGIVVVFGVLGLIGLIYFGYLLVTAFIQAQGRYKQAILLIILYLVSTAATLSLLDPQRIFYLFFIVYLIEYLTNHAPSKDLEEI